MNAIILAAGMGRRLGHGLPKCLTPLSETVSILDLQLTHLRRFVRNIRIVVGYQHELVMARYPDCLFTHNELYATTNTARSLILGLEETGPGDILWLNGDVVFSAEVLNRLLSQEGSAMAAKRCTVGDEEVKYTIAADGRIMSISKDLAAARGEAVGVNLIREQDRALLLQGLRQCGHQDYFEKGIEYAISCDLAIYEADISDLPCVEVDFPSDLMVARDLFHFCLPAARDKEACLTAKQADF